MSGPGGVGAPRGLFDRSGEMADEESDSGGWASSEVPGWLSRQSPELAAVLAPSLRALPASEAAILRRLLSDSRVQRVWDEIRRPERAGRKIGNRTHPLTITGNQLLRLVDGGSFPADEAPEPREEQAGLPRVSEATSRAALFLTLITVASIVAALPVEENDQRLLKNMETIHAGFTGIVEGGFLELADRTLYIRGELHRLQQRIKLRKGKYFRTTEDQKRFLIMHLLLLFMTCLGGAKLHGSIAAIASIALGREIGKAEVQGIYRRRGELQMLQRLQRERSPSPQLQSDLEP